MDLQKYNIIFYWQNFVQFFDFLWNQLFVCPRTFMVHNLWMYAFFHNLYLNAHFVAFFEVFVMGNFDKLPQRPFLIFDGPGRLKVLLLCLKLLFVEKFFWYSLCSYSCIFLILLTFVSWKFYNFVLILMWNYVNRFSFIRYKQTEKCLTRTR